MPAVPYNNTENATSAYNATQQWLGYCDHNGVIFPTWHRPYVLQVHVVKAEVQTTKDSTLMRLNSVFSLSFQLERAISMEANKIALMYKKSKSKWQEAAVALRWPYWDWAMENATLPAILNAPRVNVYTPAGHTENMANPFFSYTFQVHTQPPSVLNLTAMPFNSPQGSPTLRYPYIDSAANGGYATNNTYSRNVLSDVPSVAHGWALDLM